MTSISNHVDAVGWGGEEDENDDDKKVEAGGEFADDDPFFWGAGVSGFEGGRLLYFSIVVSIVAVAVVVMV